MKVASQNGSQLIDSVKFALLLTEYGIKDPETLKALRSGCSGDVFHEAQCEIIGV